MQGLKNAENRFFSAFFSGIYGFAFMVHGCLLSTFKSWGGGGSG